MAQGVNRVVLVGNLTRDPEVKHTQSGLAICELGVAVNSREKVGDDWQDRADFFDVTTFGSLADQCGEHLSKGSPIALDGKLRLDRWEKDGQKRSKVRIVADNIQFLNRGGGDEEPGQQRMRREPAPAVPPDDDIVF